MRLGGGPEYQLPSQETLVLAKAAVRALVSAPLAMMPRFALFADLLAGAAAGAGAGAAAWPASFGAVEGVDAAFAAGAVLDVGATIGAAATAGLDVLELGAAPTAASVNTDFAAGNGELELAPVEEAVMDSTGDALPA